MAPSQPKRGVSKSSALVNLNRNRQILTRLQALRIAETFPLLNLPAELRVLIYGYCIDVSGINKWFDDYWQVLKNSTRKPSRLAPPSVYKGTPAILLVCKQVYNEAIVLLEKQNLSFHHGLLDITGLDNLMNTSLIRNISHLTIDSKGHDILPKGREEARLVGPSWRGHLDMIVDVSNILAPQGHKLKTFTLNLEDKTIHSHVTSCWTKPIRCDFRDQLTEALMHLRKVRGVGTVNLSGIPQDLIDELKVCMESKQTLFLLDLPGEICNQIWSHCGDWSDISVQLARTMDAWVNKNKDPPYPNLTTPTILLLNKQVYKEAKSILHAKPLVLTLPVNHGLQKQSETLNTLRLISRATIKNIQHLDIRVESWEWMYSLDRFIPSLAKYHRLRTFKLSFKDELKATFLQQHKAYPDHTLHLTMGTWAKVRAVGLVQFEGDLPDVYTAPLKMIMEGPKLVGEQVPILKAIKYDGRVVEVDGDEQD